MKKQFPRPALFLLIIGLMMVSTAQVISHKFGLSDGATGFAVGLGIGVELVAAFVIIRNKRLTTK